MGFGSDDSYLLVSIWDYHLWLNINFVWDSVSMIFYIVSRWRHGVGNHRGRVQDGIELNISYMYWNISMDLFMHTLHQVWIESVHCQVGVFM